MTDFRYGNISILALIMIVVSIGGLCLSCTQSLSNTAIKALCIVDDDRLDLGYELHLVFFRKDTGRSMILQISGDTIIDGESVADLAGGIPKSEMKHRIEDLLDIHIDYVIQVDSTIARSLFTILDSLEAFDAGNENGYVDVYITRWRTFYKNAKLLVSDQVIDKVLDVTHGSVPDRLVRQYLDRIGESADEKAPFVVTYPVDMYHRPLYEGIYGKELVRDIVRGLAY